MIRNRKQLHASVVSLCSLQDPSANAANRPVRDHTGCALMIFRPTESADAGSCPKSVLGQGSWRSVAICPRSAARTAVDCRSRREASIIEGPSLHQVDGDNVFSIGRSIVLLGVYLVWTREALRFRAFFKSSRPREPKSGLRSEVDPVFLAAFDELLSGQGVVVWLAPLPT